MDVGVGVIDTSLGEVEQAYQMVLPSIMDLGTSSIVVSPFTSLLSKAISDAKGNIKEDLSVEEGCSAAGDSIASNISSNVSELISSIETNFGLTFNNLTSDFIDQAGDLVNEAAAQNIARILPYMQQIDSQVSASLTQTFGKDIRANVTLLDSAQDIIFGGESYTQLPLDFQSIYRTDPNSAGWYQEERIDASGAYISNSGEISRKDCSDDDTTLCGVSDLSLNTIGNASTQYYKSSVFFNPNVDMESIGINDGTLAVSAYDARSWRDNSENWNENRNRECQHNNDIQFQNTVASGTQSNFHYYTYSAGYRQEDCSGFRRYYFPILSIATIMETSVNDNSIQARYYMPDTVRTGVISSPPFDFVENRVTIDPTNVIAEMGQLPRFYSQIDQIRRLLNVEDYVLFEYHKDGSVNAYFEVGTFPRNDMYFPIAENGAKLYGQAARDAYFTKLQSEETFTADIYGSSSPVNSRVLGRIANSYLNLVDYQGSDSVTLPVYPSYDASTKTLDLSLVGSQLDLENLQDFIENGINGNPVTANLWYNPDDSIESTIPVVLYLFRGSTPSTEVAEAYFTMEFNLTVSSSEGSEENPVGRSATQTFTIDQGAITASYYEDGVTITRTITNSDSDSITVSDGLISQPSNLDLKVTELISRVADKISGIKNFFSSGGTYSYLLDLGTGGHSLVDFDRNTVDYIKGSFSVASTPTYAISVNDITLDEGESDDLCFYRPAVGDLSETSFNLSFTQRERPGRGAFADDFSLSSSTVTFSEDETQACVVVTAEDDVHFDWGHYAYLDISEPTNGQALSRNRLKITIIDSLGSTNRISFKNK